MLNGPCGVGLSTIRRPDHAWTYGLDGRLQRFPGAEPGFDDVDKTTHGLTEVPVAEAHGLVLAIADPQALHKDSIAPYYLFERWIHDAFGPHQRFIGCRKSILDEIAKPDEADWELLPHATVQYLLVPNAVLTHQLENVELWRLTPLAADRTLVRTSVYAPRNPPRPHEYYGPCSRYVKSTTNCRPLLAPSFNSSVAMMHLLASDFGVFQLYCQRPSPR